MTTKIHALTDTQTCLVAMSLTAGQAGDNPQLLPLVDGYFGADNPKSIGKKALVASLLGTLGVGALAGVAIFAYIDKSSTPAHHHPVRVVPHAPRRAPGGVVPPGVAPPAGGQDTTDPGSAPASGPADPGSAPADPGSAPDGGPVASDPGWPPDGGLAPGGPAGPLTVGWPPAVPLGP